jgi:hypothetical protein
MNDKNIPPGILGKSTPCFSINPRPGEINFGSNGDELTRFGLTDSESVPVANFFYGTGKDPDTKFFRPENLGRETCPLMPQFYFYFFVNERFEFSDKLPVYFLIASWSSMTLSISLHHY